MLLRGSGTLALCCNAEIVFFNHSFVKHAFTVTTGILEYYNEDSGTPGKLNDVKKTDKMLYFIV